MKRRLGLPFLLVSAAAVYLLCLRDEWHPTWDSGVYLSLSRSIVGGEGYTYAGLPHVKYPPGLPLLCAPIEALAGNDFLALRGMTTLFALASAYLAYRVVAAYGSAAIALPAAAWFAFSYVTVRLVPAVLSDLPFTVFALGALLALRRFRDRESWGTGLGLAGLLIASFFTRIAGAAVALACAASLLRRRLRGEGPSWSRLLLVGFLVAAPAAAWMARTALLRPGLPEWLRDASSYEREFETGVAWEPGAPGVGVSGLVGRLGRNALGYTALLGEIFSGGLLRAGRPGLLGWGIALLALAAFARAARKRRSAAELFTGGTLLLYLLWPWAPDARFLLPVLPFLFAYILEGAKELFERGFPGREGLRRAALFAVAGLALLANAPRVVETVRRERREPYHDAGTEAFLRSVRWLRENAPRELLVVSDESSAVTLFSDLRGRAFPVTRSGETLAAFVRRLATENPGSPVYLLLAPVGLFGLTHFWAALAEAREKGLLDGDVVHQEVVEQPPERGGPAGATVFRLRT